MKAKIVQILLSLFFVFPVIIQSKKSCPISSCGISPFLSIKYPFKLQKDQPPNNCQDYINLRCNEKGQAIINLPSSGDFIVTDIDYYSRKIHLSDPGNCLPRRFMTNFSLYPLEAFRYEDYKYYECPRNRIIREFSEIYCLLSNSTNATIATSGYPPGVIEGMYGCKTIVSSKIPLPMTSQYDDLGIFDYIQLTWNVSGCKDCEDYYTAEKPGDYKSKWAKFFGSSLFIPSAVVLALFFGIATLLRLMKLVAGRANSDSITANNPTTDATGAQFSATNTTLAPPQTTRGVNRTENSSEVKKCTELVVLSESQGTSIPSGAPCSICLEEYRGKDRVRFLVQCGHCFHAECIDQWLQKHTTCPVCRSSLSKH